MDFGSLDKRLASRLADDDLAAVLLGIAGASSVKRLRLTGCRGITGRGLDPLRSSSVIEQLDISCEPRGSLSEELVASILHDIINTESCSLRQLQLPKKWCGYRNRSGGLERVLREYECILRRRNFNCQGGTHEAGECFGTDGASWMDSYARQRFTCYHCLENFCQDPALDVTTFFCGDCCKTICSECGESHGDGGMKRCDDCFIVSREDTENMLAQRSYLRSIGML